MKTLAIIGVLMAACAGDCFARLGETKAQIQQRYGKPLGDGVLFGKPCSYFTEANVIITAVFDDNKSACEMIVLSVGKLHTTDPEAMVSLNEMTGTYDWQLDQKQPGQGSRWISKKGLVGIRGGDTKQGETLTAMTPAFDRDIYSRVPAGSAESENARNVAPFGKIALEQTHSEPDAIHFKRCHDRALAGDVWPQFFLGQLYLEGKGCEVNTNEAKVWFKKAADRGNDEAKKELEKLK